ncbi:hypothetical protein AXE80_10495 [Wenyingzhuangia fucanilytica]|uniref:Polyketide cyclase n=1 Tax=Wenyingzhuangia fucanilytica TaxID=1790137 RepID=A0A1B1Y7D0_9FLAO|nr:SRPBCC family protein [Wenyingzhuangia fucanilytica]ANW96675.1 hypothetical protein AXE80_10495 [Wenyingzhuangia fucanilytica]
MKKFFLYGSLVIIAAIFVMMIIAPKSETVQRSITIEEPVDVVYPYFASLQNMEDYAVWQALDPNTIHEYRGAGNSVGSVHAWKSEHEQVGVGEQEIIAMIPNKEIISELRFKEPFESTSTAFLKFEENGNQTKVIWGYEASYGALESLFMMFLDMDKLLGPDFEKGLAKAKEIIEE